MRFLGFTRALRRPAGIPNKAQGGARGCRGFVSVAELWFVDFPIA